MAAAGVVGLLTSLLLEDVAWSAALSTVEACWDEAEVVSMLPLADRLLFLGGTWRSARVVGAVGDG